MTPADVSPPAPVTAAAPARIPPRRSIRSSVAAFTFAVSMLSACTGLVSSLGSSSPSGGGSSSPSAGGSAGSCCVGRDYYACPDAAAVDRCAGALSRCMVSCMSSDDMNCPDACAEQHPADPSACSRDVAGDATCQ